MNALDMLHEDHEKAKKLLETITDTTEEAKITREKNFNTLKYEIDLHAHIEETLVYPVLERDDESRKLALEAYEEHRIAKELLNELEISDKTTEEWTAKFTVLKENVEHHIKEEEGELFDALRQVLHEDELENLGEQMLKEKKKMEQITE